MFFHDFGYVLGLSGKLYFELCSVTHAWNTSILEMEARRSGIWGQSQLYRELKAMPRNTIRPCLIKKNSVLNSKYLWSKCVDNLLAWTLLFKVKMLEVVKYISSNVFINLCFPLQTIVSILNQLDLFIVTNQEEFT